MPTHIINGKTVLQLEGLFPYSLGKASTDVDGVSLCEALADPPGTCWYHTSQHFCVKAVPGSPSVAPGEL